MKERLAAEMLSRSDPHVKRRASWAVRDRFPHRKVVRQVQGVEMVLPWSHRLPDYTAAGSDYGQNLVKVCRELSRVSTSLNILDVGANVGDSALQILSAVDARILCVEGDDSYLEFLHINVGSDPRVEIEESLVSSAPDDGSRALHGREVGWHHSIRPSGPR